MAIIKNNLKSILDEKGLKQKFVAEKADISEQTLSNCISNRYDVSLKIALQIAKALDMKVEDLFYLSDEEDITESL